ncbi:MAG: MaoC domain protein dehydratase [Conexibacter sp.]|nr:MaoC domain protein dehydratase [Conexibacter sp.]
MKTFGEFAEGMVFRTGGRTVTETHLVNFAGLSGDFHPLHADEEWCRGTPFGRRIAHGPLVYALALGLVAQANVFGEVVIAFLGADRIRHLKPVFIGMTLTVEVTILTSRPTSDGRRGVIGARYVAKDAEEVSVMVADVSFLAHGPPEPGVIANGDSPLATDSH